MAKTAGKGSQKKKKEKKNPPSAVVPEVENQCGDNESNGDAKKGTTMDDATATQSKSQNNENKKAPPAVVPVTENQSGDNKSSADAKKSTNMAGRIVVETVAMGDEQAGSNAINQENVIDMFAKQGGVGSRTGTGVPSERGGVLGTQVPTARPTPPDVSPMANHVPVHMLNNNDSPRTCSAAALKKCNPYAKVTGESSKTHEISPSSVRCEAEYREEVQCPKCMKFWKTFELSKYFECAGEDCKRLIRDDFRDDLMTNAAFFGVPERTEAQTELFGKFEKDFDDIKGKLIGHGTMTKEVADLLWTMKHQAVAEGILLEDRYERNWLEHAGIKDGVANIAIALQRKDIAGFRNSFLSLMYYYMVSYHHVNEEKSRDTYPRSPAKKSRYQY